MADIEAIEVTEQVEGMVACYNCTYQGPMTGYVRPEKRTLINFVCPECKAVEKVDNPFA